LEGGAESDIAFIDYDVFDARMTERMRLSRPLVTVRFPNQPATVNALPERMGKWLSAVEKHGGGVRIDQVDASGGSDGDIVAKDAMLVVSALVTGYRYLRSNLPALLGRGYEAVIVLEGAGGNIERVEFRHHGASEP